MKKDVHQATVEWLDSRYARGAAQGGYLPFQPVFGYGEKSEKGQVTKYARLLQILKQLARIRFTSFLDVGGAEGFTAALVRHIFGAAVVNTDVSAQACARSRELFGLPAMAVEAGALPYADNSFDVVLLSEVLEHLPDPALAILEGLRVCRRALVLTTDEVCLSETERRRELALADHARPHTERNYFVPEDFQLLLGGEGTHLQATMFFGSWDGSEPPAEDREALCRLIRRLTDRAELTEGSLGIVVVKEKEAACRGRRPKPGAGKLLERLLAFRADAGGAEPAAVLDAPELQGRLACPGCLTTDGLQAVEAESVACRSCGAGFPLQAGVPVLRHPHDAALARLQGPALDAYRSMKGRLGAVPPISSSPAVIEVVPLKGIASPAPDGYFTWCGQEAAFRFSDPVAAAGLELVLCSHHLNPPLSLQVLLGGEQVWAGPLAYGWSRSVLTFPTNADTGGDVTLRFDRPIDPGEMAALHETVPGIEGMPPGTAVRLHAVRPLSEAGRLAVRLEDQAALLERALREVDRLGRHQAYYDDLLPIRWYKKLRRMDW